jgi:L-amino acid N-acyltransferase YncA
MRTFVISPFIIEVYDEVMQLWHQCEGVGLSGADSRENIDHFLEQNPGMSFVASAEGRIIGTVLAGHDGRRGYIYHLAIHPDWRRQDLGRRLVERCLQVLQEAGILKCHLFVFNNNESGVAFWKSVGWEQRSDLLVMSRTLDRGKGEAFSTNPSATASDRAKGVHDPHFSIRKMTEQDWPAARSIFEEGISTGNATFETEAPSWEAWDTGHMKECRLMATDGERIAGWAALSRVSGRCVYAGVAEVSVYIAAGERGRGIGRRLLLALVSESEHNGIWTLQAGIFPENRPSIALHQKCGFRMIGRREKLGQMDSRWRDVLLFERRSPVIDIQAVL